jgi:hypothetical protein
MLLTTALIDRAVSTIASLILRRIVSFIV